MALHIYSKKADLKTVMRNILMVNSRLLRMPILVGNQSKFQFIKLQLTITSTSIYEKMFLTQV